MPDTAPPPHFEDDSRRIMEALAHAATHNERAALHELQPIIRRGPIRTLAMLSALAEVAVLNTRQPNTFVGLIVQTATGAPADADDLPPGVRFAARFTTAQANRDLDTARELFFALVELDEQRQADDLATGIRAVLDMAAAGAREVIARQREAKGSAR